MSEYRNLLVCLDLTEDSVRVLERAKALAAASGGTLTLLHVVEYVPVEPMGEALLPAVQIEAELAERATTQIAELANRLSLGAAERLVLTGNIKAEVVRVAQEQRCDLIGSEVLNATRTTPGLTTSNTVSSLTPSSSAVISARGPSFTDTQVALPSAFSVSSSPSSSQKPSPDDSSSSPAAAICFIIG